MDALAELAKVKGHVSIENGIATLEDGTAIDLAAASAQQAEVLASLREVVSKFQDGDCYETKNPYRRTYVERSLKAIKAATDFDGDWMQANEALLK